MIKAFKKITTFIIALVIMTSTLACSNLKMINAISNINTRKLVNAGVLLNNYYNPYNLLIKKNLEDIQIENEHKIQFTFFDGKANSAIESEIVNNMLQSNYDLLILGLIEEDQPKLTDEVIYKAKQINIPLIFFNLNPAVSNTIKSYPKAIAINTDSVQAGISQGKMIVDAWNTDKNSIDKNGDNIMQYIMIKGQSSSFSATERIKNSISTINNAGINTEELESVSANWDPDLAKSIMEQLFLKYNNKIEVIIANNDAMAIGVIQALQKYGYNMGDKTKTIPVFGIGGVPEAQELIKKGFMAGTVPQNTRNLADTFYTVGMNLVSGNDPLEGTNYNFDKTGVIMLIPFQEYISTYRKE
jgi:methyl-galactoside transport system substrate-binding protein